MTSLCENIRKALLERLENKDKGFCDDRCIALLLGSGCNKGAIPGCEFPLWPELLKKLSWEKEEIDRNRYLEAAGQIEDTFLKESMKHIATQFQEYAIVPSEKMIESMANSETAYRMVRYVKIALMSGMNNIRGAINPNSTMACVISICVKRVEKNLRTIVITYNYDDLFECKLKEALQDRLGNNTMVRSASGTLPGAADLICNGSNGPSVDIFYVHGKIPIFNEEKEAISDRIILSQQSYDILSRNHLEATNQIQYVVQAGMPTIAIGFSFDDVNFSRLRTDLLSNYRHLPPFYSLQYCASADCLACPSSTRENMRGRLNHIGMLHINTLPMPSNAIKQSFETVFNIKF